MQDLVTITDFMIDSFVKLWSAIGTWGVIGLGIIVPTVFYRLCNLLRKIFRF